MRTKRFVLANTFGAVLLVCLSLLLAACSDNTPTATSNTTSNSGATMNVNNDGPASVGAKNPTASNATVSGNNNTANLPAVKNATALNLDQSVIAAATNTIPGTTNPAFQILASGDTSDNLTANINTAFLNAGYKFTFPNATQPVKQGDSTLALYSKSGSPDVLISIYDVPTDANVLGRNIVPGLQPDSAQKLLGQLKNQKSMALVLTATNLVQFLGAQAGLTPPTGGIPTDAATSAVTSSAATTTPPVSESDLPVYVNSTKAVGPNTVGDTLSVSYLTSDSYDSVVTWAKSAYTAKGWQGITSNEQAGATIFTGRKGSATLIATVLGPQARANAGFENFFKQANAGTNDTVIVVVVTY